MPKGKLFYYVQLLSDYLDVIKNGLHCQLGLHLMAREEAFGVESSSIIMQFRV